MLTVLDGLAEFERDLIRARTAEGRERAKARGVKMGRKLKLTPHQQREAIKRHERASQSATLPAATTSVIRRFRDWGDRVSRMDEKPFVFVLMPFDREFGDVYSLGIKDAVEKAGMLAERVDEQVFHKEGILERIYNQIDLADLIIADMTGRNPNVFYEVGYAHAKNKVCILLTKNADHIPFDLKHHRHIVYASVADLRSKLRIDLEFVKEALADREMPIRVALGSITGDLSKTKYYATAAVTITLDMHNNTKTQSPEIDAIYFYTGAGWTFTQDRQECPATDSDLPEFKKRHFIRSPVQRVGRNGWVPIKIVGEKIVGTAWRGEELKDSYELTGFALVKVRTAKGDFNSRVDLKVTADDIPF